MLSIGKDSLSLIFSFLTRKDSIGLRLSCKWGLAYHEEKFQTTVFLFSKAIHALGSQNAKAISIFEAHKELLLKEKDILLLEASRNSPIVFRHMLNHNVFPRDGSSSLQMLLNLIIIENVAVFKYTISIIDKLFITSIPEHLLMLATKGKPISFLACLLESPYLDTSIDFRKLAMSASRYSLQATTLICKDKRFVFSHLTEEDLYTIFKERNKHYKPFLYSFNYNQEKDSPRAFFCALATWNDCLASEMVQNNVVNGIHAKEAFGRLGNLLNIEKIIKMTEDPEQTALSCWITWLRVRPKNNDQDLLLLLKGKPQK